MFRLPSGALLVLNRSVEVYAFKLYVKPSYVTEINVQMKLHTSTMESYRVFAWLTREAFGLMHEGVNHRVFCLFFFPFFFLRV